MFSRLRRLARIAGREVTILWFACRNPATPSGDLLECTGGGVEDRIGRGTDVLLEQPVRGKPLRVGFNPVAVDVRGHSAWVTSVADDRLTRVDFG